MTEARGSYHHGDLRRALLDASIDLVGEHGVDAFSLRAAARAAGVNPSAVYRHFADRSELLGAVAMLGFEELGTRMAKAMGAAADPRARFSAGGDAYVRFALDRPEYFRVMFGPYGSRPGSAARRRSQSAGSEWDSPYELLVGVVVQLDLPGIGSDRTDDAALTAWSAFHGLATLLVDGAIDLEPCEIDAAIAHLTRATIDGLTGDGTGG